MAERLNRVPGYVCCVSVKRQVSGDRTPGAGPGGGCGQESESPSARLRAPPPRARPAPRVLYVSQLTVHKQPLSVINSERRVWSDDGQRARPRGTESQRSAHKKCVRQRAPAAGAGRAAGARSLTHAARSSLATLSRPGGARQDARTKPKVSCLLSLFRSSTRRSIPYEKNI